MAKITYEDKEFLNKNENIADKNKVNDTDLNQIKEVINQNDDNVGNLSDLNTSDKSNLVNAINEISVIGKSIKLKKNSNQTIKTNTQTEVSWDKVVLNNTNNILTKEGNSVKCTSGTHLVLVATFLQIYANTTYCYIIKNKGISGEKNIANRRILGGSPQLITIMELSENDTVTIDAYADNTNIGFDMWSGFSVTLLN